MIKVDHTTKLLLDRYWDLCEQRDEANAQAAKHQTKLDALNAQIEALRVESIDVKGDVEACRGGSAWLDLKSDIGRLANAVKFTPARGDYE